MAEVENLKDNMNDLNMEYLPRQMLRLISDAHDLHLVEGELEDISEFVHPECENNNGSISSISSNDSQLAYRD